MNPNSSQFVKLYKINKEFYEFKEFDSNIEIIDYIIEQHLEKHPYFNKNFHKSTATNKTLNYTFYAFRHEEVDSIWKDFFPNHLTSDYNFKTQGTSFVLFIDKNNDEIFAIIGGKGLSVINRYTNSYFGIDLYEKFADLAKDSSTFIESRSVTGNLTFDQNTFRNNRPILDSLPLGRIPTKIHISLNKEHWKLFFEDVDDSQIENGYLEIGSSFFIKVKMNFKELHFFMEKIFSIWKEEKKESMSRFERVIDKKLIEDVLFPLFLEQLRDNAVRSFSISRAEPNYLSDYDLVHPQKIVQFYECDEYKLFEKGSSKEFFTTSDRSSIFIKTLEHVYNNVDPNNEFEFNKFIMGIKLKGYSLGQLVTHGQFIIHINTEVSYNRKPFFLIDNQWYQITGNFIEEVNIKCEKVLLAHIAPINLLTLKWNIINEKEGEYNAKYEKLEGYIVFDKILSQNIELCDLMKIENDKLYLIHVKEGFDAKIRDLTNQVYISANRLQNDLSTNAEFLKGIFNNYKKQNPKIDFYSLDDFLNLFKISQIIYVAAYSPGNIKKKVIKDIRTFKSNIAKVSIIQAVNEMRNFPYELKFFEIENEHI